MSIRVGAYTPLPITWKHPLRDLPRRLRIIERPTFTESNWDFWNLRRTEREAVLARETWLCVEEDCEDHDRDQAFVRLMERVRSATLGFQLWLPKGWDGIVIAAEQVREFFQVQRVDLVEPYAMPRWGRVLSVEKANPAELGPLIDGTITALESGSVPLMNPFQFLEIGLQTAFNHRNGGGLFWTFGIDGLLGGAGGQDVFAARLCRLLGSGTRVFPEDWAGRIPVYTVGEVAKEIFGFRNRLSHGLMILEKHRKSIEFKFEPAELAYLRVEDWTQKALILESALFVLLAALRRVITTGHLELMKDQRVWSRWLDSPA